MTARMSSPRKSRPRRQRKCECDLRTRVVGDGCSVCNPKLYAELMADQRKEAAVDRKAKRKEKAKRIKSRPRPSLSKLKARLWDLLSPAVKAAHPPFCFTCDAGPLAGHNHQCGHMFAKGQAHALSAFHPGNLRPQCINCNHGLEGNGAEYGRRYIAQYGEAAFEEMRALARTPHKWTPMEVEMLIAKIRVSLEHYEGYYREVYKPVIADLEGKEAA